MHLDDILYHDSIFYQHGHWCYYLTPQQYEQLTWREATIKRRRDFDVDIGLQILKRNHREISSGSSENRNLESFQESREDDDNYTIGWTQSYDIQRRLRQKEYEQELMFHRLLVPIFFQIKRDIGGHQYRFPVITRKPPFRSFKNKNSCLIRICEEENIGVESGVTTNTSFSTDVQMRMQQILFG